MPDLTNQCETILPVENPALRDYLKIYQAIDLDFLEQIQAAGLAVDVPAGRPAADKIKRLKSLGAIGRNADKSLYSNWLSPACAACRQGIDSISLYLSLMCPRHCYYCFNPNQEAYSYYLANQRDCIRELAALYKANQKLKYIALTGGEPLLHHRETIEFFRYAKSNFKRVHTRLYTAGDLLDRPLLQQLQETQLDEIRFSIKLEDSAATIRQIYEHICWAKEYIPHVLVEMPVIPGSLQKMRHLLRDLDELGVTGINLLEFCFPFHNAAEFRKRSFTIKNPPFQVLYNYRYAGGLPVSQSETACLELIEFAIREKLRLGVHYCSLENKFTEQIYQQNSRHYKLFPLTYFSPHDFFLKTAKVFGDDIPTALRELKSHKTSPYRLDKKYGYLEIPVQAVPRLKKLDLAIGLCSHIIENREGKPCLRELKVDVIRTGGFDIRQL
ncbi:radical SAM protein [Sporomusa acidovorans]|uniref:Radical SAM core domain-containing protein n=1 Tax=Sporomusa acidovorans (strain ATCC 49682 / DSM 3132 / Mol) TaxID=1123286 RepID=A0ABZ3J972_SPOA4|nr:radical SAM protein [Sporomusa acidovorans]OZC24129.1 7-carboxy-7-deazaguanine synthase [Sporomusa acidovorans DSM 3132]SDF71665.1 Uncharacterized conserved protein [Sporomusa acidovorans]